MLSVGLTPRKSRISTTATGSVHDTMEANVPALDQVNECRKRIEIVMRMHEIKNPKKTRAKISISVGNFDLKSITKYLIKRFHQQFDINE